MAGNDAILAEVVRNGTEAKRVMEEIRDALHELIDLVREGRADDDGDAPDATAPDTAPQGESEGIGSFLKMFAGAVDPAKAAAHVAATAKSPPAAPISPRE